MFCMVRTVNKGANPGYAVSLVVEIGLNGDVSRRGVLRVIRKPQPIPIEKIKEAPLETRRGVQEANQSGIGRIVRRAIVRRSVPRSKASEYYRKGATQRLATREIS